MGFRILRLWGLGFKVSWAFVSVGAPRPPAPVRNVAALMTTMSSTEIGFRSNPVGLGGGQGGIDKGHGLREDQV